MKTAEESRSRGYRRLYMPKFSIIIPVYNVAPYLRECLDSVLAAAERLEVEGGRLEVEQRNLKNSSTTVQPSTSNLQPDLVEIICVDDGSTDGSGAILDEYAERLVGVGSGSGTEVVKFVVIHQANAGVSAARNAALDVATGEWIAFVDGDDVLLPNHLTEICRLGEMEKDVDCVRLEWQTVRGEKPWAIENEWDESAEKIEDVGRVLSAAWKSVSIAAMPFLYCFRRSVIADTRFRVGVRFREDALFELEVFTRVKKLMVGSSKSYLYRRFDGAASYSQRRSDSRIFLSGLLDVWCKQKRQIGDLASARAACTHLMNKDVTRWVRMCKDKTKGDLLSVAWILWKAYFSGALSPLILGKRRGFRLWAFMLTASGHAFTFNVSAFLGRGA